LKPAACSFSCSPAMAVNRAGTMTFGALIRFLSRSDR
jgi:hypothetical protein